MAMTSEEVSRLIATQTAAVQQANAYAMRYGSGGFSANLSEQGPEGDPVGSALPSMSANIGTYVGNIPNAVSPAVTLAAGFGYLPRVLDPFTQSLAVGNVAAKAAGGWMGGGLAAGLGAAAVPFAAYAAAGAAMDHLALDPFKTGAQMRGASLGAIQSFMPDSPVSSMAATAQMMESLQRNKQFSMQDTMGLMGLGVAGGSINTSNMASFQSSFKALINETQQVAQALSTSLSEAYGAMQQIKGLGVSNVAGTAYSMRGLGVAGGISPAEMMGIAQGGSALAKMAGISRDLGVHGAMTSASTFGMVGNSGALGADFGVQDLATMQNAAYRFFGSRQGSSVVAAMMGENGEINSTVAAQIAQGTMSKAEINRLANITRNKRPDLLQANSTELVATYLSEYGPQGIANPLNTMTRGMAHPETMRMQLTGLNQEQMTELGALNFGGNSIKAQIQAAAQEGFAQGTKRLGLADSLQLAMSKMLAPVKDKFQQMGAEVTQSIAETADNLTRDFLTRPALSADMSGANAIRNFNASGNYTAAQNVRLQMNQLGDMGLDTSRAQPGFLSSAFMPQGLYASADNQYADRQFMGGFTPRNPGMGALLTGGAVAAARSRLVDYGAIGLRVLGSEMVDRLPATGFMGSRQLASFAALGARGTQAAGWALTGFRALGGPVGIAIAATEAGIAGINYMGSTYGASTSTDADAGPIGEMVRTGHLFGRGGDGTTGTEIAGTEGLRTVYHAADPYRLGSTATTSLSRTVDRYTDDEARAEYAWRIKNMSGMRATRTKVMDDLAPEMKLAAMNITSSTATEEQKIVRLNKLLGVSHDDAAAMVIASPHSALQGLSENRLEREAEKWFAAMKAGTGSERTFGGYGWEAGWDTSTMNAVRWLEKNQSLVTSASAQIATSGAVRGDRFSDEYQLALREKVLAQVPVEQRTMVSGFLSNKQLASSGIMATLAGVGIQPLVKGYEKQIAANKELAQKELAATEKAIDYAAASVGIDPSVLRNYHKAYVGAHVEDSSLQAKDVEGAVNSMAGATSAQQALFAKRMASSGTMFGIEAAGLASVQARVKALDEQHLDGSNSRGRAWVEEFLGVSLKGVVDDKLQGRNGVTPAAARMRITEGVENMMKVALGRNTLSTEELRIAEINTSKIIDHAREKGGAGGAAAIANLFKPMQTRAAPEKTDGQQAMLIARFEKAIEAVTTGMTELARRLPQTSNG